MKSWFLILLLIANFLGRDNYVITGEIKFCESELHGFGNEFNLLKNNQVVKKIISDYSGNFEIENLEKGEYIIEYENVYQQILRKQVNVEKRQNLIELCLDEFVDTKVSTLFSTLKNGDSLTINIGGSGCFHSFEDQIKFYRKKGKYFGETFTAKKEKITKSLDKKKLDYLILWEKQARKIDKVDGFCTSNTTYDFKLNGKQMFRVSDGTCQWDGYSKIRKETFGL